MTFAQLDKEIAHKTTAIKASIELTSLERVREYLAPHMASKPDEPIGPVLARLAAEEAAAKKLSVA